MPPFLLYVGIWYLIAQLDDPYIDICVLIIILQPRSQRNIVQQCTRNRTPMVNYWLKRTHIYSINLSDSEIVCSTYQWVGIVMKRKKRAFLSNQIVPMGRRPWYIFKLYVLYFTFLYCCICVYCIVFAVAPPWYRPAPEWSGWKRAGEHPDTDQLAKLGLGSSKCSVFVPMCSQFCMYVLGIYIIVSQSSAFVSMCSVFVSLYFFFLYPLSRQIQLDKIGTSIICHLYFIYLSFWSRLLIALI